MLSRAAWASDEPTDVAQVPLVDAYLGSWGGQPAPPRIALSRGIYPAADRRTALAELRDDLLHSERIAQQRQTPPPTSIEQICQQWHIAYGHPDQIAATLAADRIMPFATDLIVQFNPMTPPPKRAIWMLEQVATRIAPALGWQPQPTQRHGRLLTAADQLARIIVELTKTTDFLAFARARNRRLRGQAFARPSRHDRRRPQRITCSRTVESSHPRRDPCGRDVHE